MSKRAGVLSFLLFAGLFLAMNRGAYRGYFQPDELDNLSWAPALRPVEFLKGAVSPLFQSNNFRPVGHFYFHAAGRLFGLDFPPYVAIIQALHLLNVWLVWLLARRLGAKAWTAAAACAFFGFHMAMFDAFWKPMYVFDVLCATFCLLSILAYSRRSWVLSFVAFWLAYKCKEVAVMLPLVLACYEYWFGKRRWIRLAPFFVASLSFGIQGLLLNPNKDNDYTFRFTAAALATTSVFYAQRVFLVPFLGFALPVATLTARNRRTWFGLAMALIFAVPLLFLPGRLFAAYCYVPFTGLALAFAGIAESSNPGVVAAFLLLWAPLELRELRTQRRATLAADNEFREWVTTAKRFSRTAPRPEVIVYAGAPAGFYRWGAEGALRYLFGAGAAIRPFEDPGAAEALRGGRAVLLNWDADRRRLDVVSQAPGQDASYIQINGATPVWQLERGWYGLEGAYRWIAPQASARLSRPEGARKFVLRVNVGPELLSKAGPETVRISLNGRDLAPRRFAEAGWHEAEWELEPAPAGAVEVDFRVEPGMRPPGDHPLGIAVGGFGFR